jgi:hypothetical protein
MEDDHLRSDGYIGVMDILKTVNALSHIHLEIG